MNWFNYYGLIIMAVIMIPNIIYAVLHKNNSAGAFNNKAVIIAEQIGRYGCFIFMIFNISTLTLVFGSIMRLSFICP